MKATVGIEMPSQMPIINDVVFLFLDSVGSVLHSECQKSLTGSCFEAFSAAVGTVQKGCEP